MTTTTAEPTASEVLEILRETQTSLERLFSRDDDFAAQRELDQMVDDLIRSGDIAEALSRSAAGFYRRLDPIEATVRFADLALYVVTKMLSPTISQRTSADQ